MYSLCIMVTQLLLICQRYNFESNSQRAYYTARTPLVVTDMSKIQFWKQFTTTYGLLPWFAELLLICQRYNFESNSQHDVIGCWVDKGCYWYVKDTILKAIHNLIWSCPFSSTVVTDMSKIQFWKQFTTLLIALIPFSRCYWYVKDTILKAIHNFVNLTWKVDSSCYWYVKDTILKAIHNVRTAFGRSFYVVTDMSKIQFWKQFTTIYGY